MQHPLSCLVSLTSTQTLSTVLFYIKLLLIGAKSRWITPYRGSQKISVTAWCHQLLSPQTVTLTCASFKDRHCSWKHPRGVTSGVCLSLFVSSRGDDRSLVITECMSVCVHMCSGVTYIKQELSLQAIPSYVFFVVLCERLLNFSGIFANLISILLVICLLWTSAVRVCRFFSEWQGGTFNFFWKTSERSC